MSNNQKAVKYNPSDSKNVIQFALLHRSKKRLRLFLVLNAQSLKPFYAYSLKRKSERQKTNTGMAISV
jgi:hypothetical protein